MKAFIILSALMALAAAKPGGLLPLAAYYGAPGGPADTPEVAQAKAAHFAQYNYEAARNSLGPAPIAYAAGPLGYIHYGGAPIVADTPEVAYAKASHFAAHAHEAAKHAGHPYGALAYSAFPAYGYGYPYTAPIGLDGNVVDTPEVALAKAEHFAAHAMAKNH